MGDIIQESLDGGATLLSLHPDWKISLREDLLDHFTSVSSADRREYRGGRVPHFSYQPKGSPSRVFVREIHRGGWLRFLGNFHLGSGRLQDEIRAVEKVRKAGVPVPAILGTKASRIFGPFYRLTVVLEEIQNAESLFDRAKSLPGRERRRIIEEVARHLRTMHDSGVYHVDLTVLNILVDGPGKIHIIDLDKAQSPGHKVPSRALRVLARFTRSVEKKRLALSRLERIRFLRTYLGNRNGIKALAEACTRGLWVHRLGWKLTGHSRTSRG